MAKNMYMYFNIVSGLIFITQIALLICLLLPLRPFEQSSFNIVGVGLQLTLGWAFHLFICAQNEKTLKSDNTVRDFTNNNTLFASIVTCFACSIVWTTFAIAVFTIDA